MSREHMRIGSSTDVSGRFETSGDLVLAGTVTGELEVKGRLHVLNGARIAGPLQCESLELDGTIEGDVIATEHARIGRRGCLRGRLETARVDFDEGARYAGELHLDHQGKIHEPQAARPLTVAPPGLIRRTLRERLVPILPAGPDGMPAIVLGTAPEHEECTAGTESGGASE